MTGCGAGVGLSTEGTITRPACVVMSSSSSSSQLPERGRVLEVGVRGDIERASGELAFDIGVRKEAVLGEGLALDDGAYREDVDGIGAGVVATGPGDSADTIDCETSARRIEARFWLFENLDHGGVSFRV